MKMSLSIFTMVVSVLLRMPAIYIGLLRVGYVRLDSFSILLLSVISAFLGFIMPAGFCDVAGIVMRVALFAIFLVILMRLSIFEAFSVIVTAMAIEFVILLALFISPLSWLVQGLSLFSIP